MRKKTSTDLWGIRPLQNEFENTVCETKSGGSVLCVTPKLTGLHHTPRTSTGGYRGTTLIKRRTPPRTQGLYAYASRGSTHVPTVGS